MDPRRVVRAAIVHWPLLLAIGVGAATLVYLAPLLYFTFGLFYFIAISRPPNWDVVEPKGSDCHLTDEPALRNHGGVEAVLRFANCPGDFAQGTAYDVVFVHPFGSPNSKSNLAFQYTPGFEGSDESPPPKIAWKGAKSLEISVPGITDSIKVQKDEVSSVQVTYKLGRQPQSPNVFQLLKEHVLPRL
jgi:hypothetical protein